MTKIKERIRRQPSEYDLEIYERVRHDLMDKLYMGLTGRFQIRGHQKIGEWSTRYADQTVLEIGCGHGHHLLYCGSSYRHYIGLDINFESTRTIRERYPATRAVNADAYVLPFRSASVDCVISVYNFEHLRQLAESLKEIRRVMKPGAELLFGIPAEGSLLYEVGRQLTSKRYMEHKYGIDYDAIVHWSHWNNYPEVMAMVKDYFIIEEQRFIPFDFLPTYHLNVVACLKAIPKVL
jgi:SAM-dependent methyltransferase